MQDRHAVNLEARLDRDQYRDDELISIKTPLNLPYYTSSAGYERAYGSVEINGITYEYVKRRVHQDTLELLCLPDKAKMKLQSVKNELITLSVDGSSPQQQKKSLSLKIGLPDFCNEITTFSLHVLTADPTIYHSSNAAFLKADYSSKGEQPPESMRFLTQI